MRRPCSGEGKHVEVDVRIEIEVVRIVVVCAVVTFTPPAHPDTEQQVAEDEAEQARQTRRAEHLPVSDVVPEQTNLAEHERQVDDVQNLYPGWQTRSAHQDQQAEPQHQCRASEFRHVIRGLPLQQACLQDQLTQLRVVGRVLWRAAAIGLLTAMQRQPLAGRAAVDRSKLWRVGQGHRHGRAAILTGRVSVALKLTSAANS